MRNKRDFSRLSFRSLLLFSAAVLCYFGIEHGAHSQIDSRKVAAPFSGKPAVYETFVAPKGPVQVALPPAPPSRYIPGLEEPLIATGPVTEEESKALDAALASFHQLPLQLAQGSDYSDFVKPLLSFMKAHPNSNWNASLNLDIGLGYYYAGYFSRTFGYFERAWKLGRNADSVAAKRMTDRAVGELAEMHARLGHAKELEALFADIGNRPLSGPGRGRVDAAKGGLFMFRNNPGLAYLCGPAALRNILYHEKASEKRIKVADDARSGPNGVSLEELAQLSAKAGLKYKIVQRKPGQPIPVPSIIHWGMNHYAAITAEDKGVYDIADPTFVNMNPQITRKAIDTESSGYFLVPVTASSAKNGWRDIALHSAEAKATHGKGWTYNFFAGMGMTSCDSGTDPEGGGNIPAPSPSGGDQCPVSPPQQMTIASAKLAGVSLHLEDTPVGYQPQVGPAAFDTISYNGQDMEPTANAITSSLSGKWSHTWQAFLVDNPVSTALSTRIAPGGGGYDYGTIQAQGGRSYYSTAYGIFIAEIHHNARLSRTPISGTAANYTRSLRDGTVETYNLSDGATTFPRRLFLTKITDPKGNAITINYDASFRVSTVVDAMGRSMTFTYGLTGYPMLITKITDGFGRFTQLTYDTSQRLSSITDPVGIVSSFTYSTTEPDFVTRLTTPYGTSKFSDTPNPSDPPPSAPGGTAIVRSLAMTDPLGNTELLYFYQNQTVTGTPASETSIPPAPTVTDNGLLQYRNTYYWDAHQAAGGGVTVDANGNPTAETWAYAPTGQNLPTIYHWLHLATNYYAPQLGSVKKPMEHFRQWYTNYGSPSGSQYGYLSEPYYTSRIVDGGATQFYFNNYNASTTIPAAGVIGNLLGNQDEITRQTGFHYAANNIDINTISQRTALPSTNTTIATFGSYNSQHLPASYTGADGQTWNYTYQSTGQLHTVKDPNLGVTTYNYDASNRLSSITDANSVTSLTLTYDSADRIRTRTDSNGYTLTYDYDNNDRITKITYPDATTDLYDYTFQSGPNVGTQSLDLRKYTDRLGRITTKDYDADRRLTSVTETTSTGVTRTTGYSYYENGTLKELTDAQGNVTHWDIDIQSRPTAKTYAYGTASAKTETYAYETNSSRLHSITDANGQTKTFTYALDNRITNIAYTGALNPTPNVSFVWDQFYPRLKTMTDGTGTTTYSYTPVGTLGALKLSSIAGPYTNSTIGFTYDNLGRLATRTVTGGNESFGYDAISRLSSHVTPLGTFTYGYLNETSMPTSQSVTNGAVTVSTGWGYDTAVNDKRLISITNSGVSRSYGLSYLNGGATNPYDIMSITDTAATGHPFATQTHSYGYDKVDRLLTANATTPGNFAYGYDKVDNATSVTTPSGSVSPGPSYNPLNQLATWASNTYAYDNNGNTTSGDGTKTYKWDAENRLVEIDYPATGNKSVFTYDGLNHRISDAETVSGVTTTTYNLWCGDVICQTRNSSHTVTRRDLPEGEYNVTTGQKLVYLPDQLGSVRDVIDAATGTRVQSYDYTPWGGTAQTNGSNPTDYQYARLYKHTQSGLNISTFRVIDPVTGRWVNRDPIRELGGINAYAYVEANPISGRDPLGLCNKQPDDCGTPTSVKILNDATEQWGPTLNVFYYQILGPNGNPLTGSGYEIKENISGPAATMSDNGNGVFKPIVGTSAQISDMVGLYTVPSPNAEYILYQTFVIRCGGHDYNLTTELKHDTTVDNGTVTNTVTVVKP